MKLFTFPQIPENTTELLVVSIYFFGSDTLKYNVPYWHGTFELPLGDDFFVADICDGGGWVEIVNDKNETIKITPICPKCECGLEVKHSGGFEFEHYCVKECGYKVPDYV